MGIKHFWGWYSKKFTGQIQKLKQTDQITTDIDTLLVDLNGIFHNSAQKVYKYGNYAPRIKTLMRKVNKKQPDQRMVFEDVCHTVDKLVKLTKSKNIVLCSDGCAPLGKQCQQRQRRYRSAMESSNDAPFDSNSITVGTKFLNDLSRYVDWYIKMQMTSGTWQGKNVIFSNEHAPGEGEHKLMNYLRKYGKSKNTYCLHGLDADLIMLALDTGLPNFYILRDDMYDRHNDFFFIDIGSSRSKLEQIMIWKSENHIYNPRSGIDDFVFICFMVGNDFLPHVPSIEIIENGIEIMLKIYRNAGSIAGHLTSRDIDDDSVSFNSEHMKLFLDELASNEQELLELKLVHKDSFFKDELLENCATFDTADKPYLDIDRYRNGYVDEHFSKGTDIEKVCHDYLDGMQWVIKYYSSGVPDWKWYFPYQYVPSAHIISKHIKTYKNPIWTKNTPTTPFQQMMCVLPPKSAYLIPYPFKNFVADKDGPLGSFCPKHININISGKRREWEGIVELPMVDFSVVQKIYDENIEKVDKKCTLDKVESHKYYKVVEPYRFMSIYGTIDECTTKSKSIQF